jgi:opacity protein-like surface antigen
MLTTKLRRRVALICGLLVPLAPVRSEANYGLYPEGFYGWYEVGPNLIEDAKLEGFFGETVTDNQVRFSPGFHFGLGFGQELTPQWRIEFETGYNFNALDSIRDATASTADLHRVPVLANLVWQLPNRTGFVPTVGVGLGGQWLHLAAKDVAFGLTTLDDSAHTWAFTYQAFAGVRCELNERFSLGLFYRYQVAEAPSWKFNSVPGGTMKLNQVAAHSLSFLIGWSY